MSETEDSFALPQHGLYADLATGAGCVRFADDFMEVPPLQRARIIAAWRRDLVDAEVQAIRQLFDETRAKMPDQTREEQLARFRALCLSVGISVPDDLAATLPS